MLVSKTIEIDEDTLRKTSIKSIRTVITNGSGASTTNYPKVVNLTDFEYTTIGGTEILSAGDIHIKIVLPTDITNNYITYFYVNNKNSDMIVSTEGEQYNYTIKNAFTRNGKAVFNASFRDNNDRVAFQIGSNVVNDSDQETYNMSVNTKYYSFIFNESDIPSEIEPESTQNIKNVIINRNYDSVNPLIIEPDEGYDNMDAVSAVVSVPQPRKQIWKSISVSENGVHYIYPDTGYDVLGAATAVVNVPNGTETATITSNGTYTPTSPNIGFSSVTVNVPQEDLNIENSKLVTYSTNGLRNVLPSSGFDALSKVQVNVAVPNETETTTITSNGTYTPTSPNIGFSSVTVNVPQEGLNIENNKTLATITSNGNNVVTPSTGYDAMSQVTFSVNVPNGTETTTITSNGIYTPSSSNIGFSSVTVNVPEKQLESRQVYYSSNGTFRLSPSTGYDGFTYADIEIAVPATEKLIFNKFLIYYYESSNGSEKSKYLNPLTMDSLSGASVAVQSGHSLFYISTHPTQGFYEIGFFNNNSGNTHTIFLLSNTLYNISTANFISAVTLMKDNSELKSRMLETQYVYGSVPYELGYSVKTKLPTDIYQFNSS